eukprot:GFUD01076117.1.p1 GENE.GFUD01076117.1~~GFUD01076117.1.p1  ORF type:complete len:154 (+),score=56.53 GFUD01076117.1:42-464(+)
MAQACKATGGAGLSHSRGYEDAVNAKISGELNEVESTLPENIKDRALSVFKAAVSEKYSIIQAIEKVEKEALGEIETVFKGQRFKGFIKFDFDSWVVTISVNKFGNGSAQFSAGVGQKKLVCPDPFMGRLSDPNMNRSLT